ncbi:MAG: DUF3267 domain-containing protein [Bacillaceae bacterium]|nr:DUF3267 domain-containing protein [Bacillaceae bacterium]
MNCWKTINITRQIGIERLYLLSVIFGMISFIFLFLPYSIFHQEEAIKDIGMLPMIVIMLILPMLHNLAHIIPLGILNNKFKLQWKLKYRFIPMFSYQTMTSLSKKTTMFMWLAPTLLITAPCLVLAALFPGYYPYLLVFAAVNIGLSFTDFLYIKQFLHAPKKCIIENARDGYDILIKK